VQKNRIMIISYCTIIFVCISLFTGAAQAALILDTDPTTLLIARGDGADPSTQLIDGKYYKTILDSPEIVNWLLDEYYEPDIETLRIGKFEEVSGVLEPVEFSSYFQPSWFTWEGTILNATSGTGIITIPTGFEWTGRIWYSIKASNGFGLYETGLTKLEERRYEIAWDITDWTANGLSHFSLWTEEGSAPIPEPATMLLFGTGLVGIAALRLRRKNS